MLLVVLMIITIESKRIDRILAFTWFNTENSSLYCLTKVRNVVCRRGAENPFFSPNSSLIGDKGEGEIERASCMNHANV